MPSTIAQEVLGVRSLLDSPLDQAPTFEDILGELEAEYQQVLNELNDRSDAWSISTYTFSSVAGQGDYELQSSREIDLQLNIAENRITLNSGTWTASDVGKTITLGYPLNATYTILTVDEGNVDATVNTVFGSGISSIVGILETPLQDFYKALAVTTVPENINADPEYVLEFTELEHLPKEWAWLSQNKGQYMESSHDAQLIAFYRKMGTYSEEIWCQIRPIPSKAESYKILYQQSDWWDKFLDSTNYAEFRTPHSTQRMYIRGLVALNLLYKGSVKWSFNDMKNELKTKSLIEGLEKRVARYRKSFDEYKDSLDQSDIVYATAWANELGMD